MTSSMSKLQIHFCCVDMSIRTIGLMPLLSPFMDVIRLRQSTEGQYARTSYYACTITWGNRKKNMRL